MSNEQTKKCRECLAEIPAKARKCSHCGSKQPASIKSALTVILLGAVFVIYIISSLDTARDNSISTYTPPVHVSTFELGAYKVESEEFQYITPKEVNLWQSYSDRKKVGSVKEHAVIEVTKHDDTNDYCKVKAGEQVGWMACSWLVKQ